MLQKGKIQLYITKTHNIIFILYKLLLHCIVCIQYTPSSTLRIINRRSEIIDLTQPPCEALNVHLVYNRFGGIPGQWTLRHESRVRTWIRSSERGPCTGLNSQPLSILYTHHGWVSKKLISSGRPEETGRNWKKWVYSGINRNKPE